MPDDDLEVLLKEGDTAALMREVVRELRRQTISLERLEARIGPLERWQERMRGVLILIGAVAWPALYIALTLSGH